MSNRVIKDLIWTSPRLAGCSMTSQLHFPRLMLLSDDWGCFNADPEVIKGLAYPKMKILPKKISEILKELYDEGLLFIWKVDHHIWGCWMKWEEHNFSSGSEYNNGGERVKHRRKTPIPPEKELKKYISEHLGTIGDNLEKSASNPNPNPNPNPKHNLNNIEHFETKFEEFWENYHPDGKKNKQYAKKRFLALCKKGKLDDFEKGYIGYANFLRHKELNENFEQRPKYFSTLITDYEEYIDFKYKPPL